MPENLLIDRQTRMQVTAFDGGRAFANADAPTQADFLRGVLAAIEDWEHGQAWAALCQELAAELNAREIPEVRSRLATLLDYLSAKPADDGPVLSI